MLIFKETEKPETARGTCHRHLPWAVSSRPAWRGRSAPTRLRATPTSPALRPRLRACKIWIPRHRIILPRRGRGREPLRGRSPGDEARRSGVAPALRRDAGHDRPSPLLVLPLRDALERPEGLEALAYPARGEPHHDAGPTVPGEAQAGAGHPARPAEGPRAELVLQAATGPAAHADAVAGEPALQLGHAVRARAHAADLLDAPRDGGAGAGVLGASGPAAPGHLPLGAGGLPGVGAAVGPAALELPQAVPLVQGPDGRGPRGDRPPGRPLVEPESGGQVAPVDAEVACEAPAPVAAALLQVQHGHHLLVRVAQGDVVPGVVHAPPRRHGLAVAGALVGVEGQDLVLHFGVQFMFDQAQILDSSQQWDQADLDVLLGAGEDEAGGSFRRIALSGGASFDRSTIRLSQQFRISASDEVVFWIDAFATRGVIGSIPPEALDARVSDGEGQYQRCTGRGCPLPGIAARAQGDYVVVEHHVLLVHLPVPQLLDVKTPRGGRR